MDLDTLTGSQTEEQTLETKASKMETPLKSTRRRLKKVLKKSKTNVSLNANSLYQKKLKSAINVSLNSSLTFRTLQTNNRSLASSLEKMRQDFRQAHEHYTRLLEENHLLRERILELQRIDASEKFIEDEVNKRFEDRMKDVENKLNSLYGYTRGILTTLAEFTDVCVNKPLSVDDVSSMESSNHNYTLLSSAKPASDNLSLDETSDDESAPSGCSPEVANAQGDNDKIMTQIKDNVQEMKNLHEMTMIMEQSVLFPPAESTSRTDDKLDTVSEMALSVSPVAGKQKTTKLPMRVPLCSVQLRTPAGNQTSGNNAKSLQKVLRRETFSVAATGSPDGALLTDTTMPAILNSNDFVENELFYVENQDPVSTFTSPSKRRQIREKNIEKLKSNKEKYNSSEQPQPKTLHHNEDRSPIKLSPNQQRQSPVGRKCTRKQSLPERASRSQSRTGRTSPKKLTNPATPKAEKQQAATEGLHQKSATRSKKKKKNLPSPKFNKVSPKHLLRLEDKQKINLLITNEFSLLNAYKQRTDATHHKSDQGTIVQHCHSYGEHTIFPIDDMELTKMEEGIINESTKHLTKNKNSCNEKKNEESQSHSQKTHISNDAKHNGHAVAEAQGAGDEKVPDAVTTRVTKPGKFTFAASRKESDGTRKNVPVAIPKARSKSKKQLADMIEKLPDTQPQSIFDFHEKTPGFLVSEKVCSVFNISADESSLSPMIPLNKNRSHNRKSNMSTDLSVTSPSQSENIDINKIPMNLFTVDQTFEEPVKFGSPPSKSVYTTRSRSRGRKLYDSESEKVEVVTCSSSRKRSTRSSSRKRSTHPKMESQVDIITTTSSEATSGILCSMKETSPETINKHREQSSSTELTSIDGKREDISPLESAQPEGSSEFLESEMKAKERESISAKKRISGKKDSCILTETRRNASEMNKNKNRNKDIFSDPENESPHLETNEQTVEKEYVGLHESDNLNSIDGVSQVDLTCQTTSGVSSSKSEDTNNLFSDFDEALISCEENRAYIQESKSLELVNTETFSIDILKGKKSRSRSTVTKRSKNSSSLVKSPLEDDDIEIIPSEVGNFICTRKNRTKGKKEVKYSKELPFGNDSKGVQIFRDDVAADGDLAVRTQFTHMKDVYDGTGTDLLLEKLKHLKSPALSYSEEGMHSETSSDIEKSQKTAHCPRISKIVKGLPSERPSSAIKRTTSASSPESLAVVDGKRRRAGTKVNYAEVALNSKLRRGDPHTSHYCTTEKIAIYKSPKSKAKKKIVHRQILGNLQNLSIREEQGLPSEVK